MSIISFKELDRKETLLLISSFLMLMVFLIWDQLTPPFILLFVLTTIPFWKWKFNQIGRFLLVSMILFYLLHVLSITYSDNWTGVGDLLMTKFSLLLFPVVALLMDRGQKTLLLGMKWGLIIGAGVSMTFSLARFAFVYLQTGERLFGSEFSFNMHTSYMALLLIFACIFLFYERKTLGRFHWVWIPYVVGALVSVVLLRSLGAIVCIAVMFAVLPVWYAFKKRKKRWLFAFPAYALLFFLLIFTSPRLKNDVTTTWNRTTTWMESPEQFLLDNKNDLESNTVRLVVWTLSSRAIADHPMGVGIGDKWETLEFYYRGKGFTYYVYKELNVHNQFLETGVAVGVFGIVLLMAIFVQTIVLAWRNGQTALFLIFLCLFASLLFESMLERSVGVIALSLMVLMLVQTLRLESEDSPEYGQKK